MKLFFTAMLIAIFTATSAFSQFGLGEALKRKVEEKTEKAVEKAFEEETDEEKEQKEENQDKEKTKPENAVPAQPTMQTYSKFDFVPGENITFFDDFSQDAVGDFPSLWNTNGSGEVITTNLYPGKWLKMVKDAFYVPDLKYPFPENYTIEFDMIYNFDMEFEHQDFGFMTFEIMDIQNIKENIKESFTGMSEHYYNTTFEVEFQFFNESRAWIRNPDLGNAPAVENTLNGTWMVGMHRKLVHFSICVNKQRFRAWVNQTKIFDIPRIMSKDAKYNTLRFTPTGINALKNYDVLISNLKFAEGTVDARSKLITEGKLVTNAISFDSGSDKIKPESYPTLKSIADALIANPDVKIMIIGHTDTDGNAAKNLTLSEARAAAVKNSLVKDFKISDSRISTSGKGDKEPVADNTKPEGKAKNRRVEFIKL